jgi:sugar phosphate isomerase/epimerase
VERAAGLGLRLVQIADNIPLEKCSGGALREVRAAAVDLGVAVEVGTRGIRPEHLRRMIELCGYFESPLLRVVVDTADDHPAEDEVVRRVTAVLPDLERAGVRLAIENHDRFTARTFVSIVERCGGGRVGICLDTVNSFGALEGPEVVIATLAPYVLNLHLKDFTIRRASHMMGFEITGAPAGQGRLQIPALLERLRDRTGCNAILELWPAPEESIEETVAKERRWTGESVRYLRTLLPE